MATHGYKHFTIAVAVSLSTLSEKTDITNVWHLLKAMFINQMKRKS